MKLPMVDQIAMTIGPLLAQLDDSPATNLTSGAEHSPFSAAAVALWIGAVSLVLLAAMIVSSLLTASARREVNHPGRLLRQLCEAHGLRRRHQRVLLAAARVIGLAQPARFFLEPGLLIQATEHAKLSSRRHELAEIGSELFGSRS
jgi:hypothetical protein